jgi:hypothetical protein
MSDTTQGPDWWLAYDCKWYPLLSAGEPPRLPPSEVLAVQKSVRRWGCFVPIGIAGIAIVGVIIFIIVAIVSFQTSFKDFPFGSQASWNKNPAGCTNLPPTYPNEQVTDCVALPDNTVSIGHTAVTATWSRSPAGALGSASICAAVKIVNHRSSTINYNAVLWSLQSPNGAVVRANVGVTGDLGSGDLVAGGTAEGNVCFDDLGQAGTFVGSYMPDVFNPTRGIWLVPLS